MTFGISLFFFFFFFFFLTFQQWKWNIYDIQAFCLYVIYIWLTNKQTNINNLVFIFIHTILTIFSNELIDTNRWWIIKWEKIDKTHLLPDPKNIFSVMDTHNKKSCEKNCYKDFHMKAYELPMIYLCLKQWLTLSLSLKWIPS